VITRKFLQVLATANWGALTRAVRLCPGIALLWIVGLQVTVHGEELNVRWREAPAALIIGRKVEVGLTGNAVLHGKALATTPGGLRMEITKTRNSERTYEKGEYLIPAAQIALVKVNRNRLRGRIIMTSVFGALSAFGTAFAILESGGGSPTAGAIGVIAAFPAAGYGLGWLLDRKSLTLHILPERVNEGNTGGPCCPTPLSPPRSTAP
jgi:hypothetical protein